MAPDSHSQSLGCPPVYDRELGQPIARLLLIWEGGPLPFGMAMVGSSRETIG